MKMDRNWYREKEEAILCAKDHLEDAALALTDFLPEAAEEVRWLQDNLQKEYQSLRGERLSLMESQLYGLEASA